MHDNIHDMIRQEPVLATLRRDRKKPGRRQSRISQFQEKAEELRAVAEDVILSETKQMLWRLADNYERMARHLTELTRQPS
ncbi:MAG: hypothetical protein JOY77_06735 [Alphaproteobacteria bacterium]|nr:hypothetical protein [Alphaproteobacteria bacterium]